MGMDASAKAAIGFVVTREDFIQYVQGNTKFCRCGHPQPNSKMFCADDGTPFNYSMKVSATEALIFLTRNLPDFNNPDDVHDWWHEFCLGDTIFDAENSEGERTLICGVKIANSGSHRNGSHITILTWEQIQASYQKVDDLRFKLGFSDRPIKFFSWLRTSY